MTVTVRNGTTQHNNPHLLCSPPLWYVYTLLVVSYLYNNLSLSDPRHVTPARAYGSSTQDRYSLFLPRKLCRPRGDGHQLPWRIHRFHHWRHRLHALLPRIWDRSRSDCNCPARCVCFRPTRASCKSRCALYGGADKGLEAAGWRED